MVRGLILALAAAVAIVHGGSAVAAPDCVLAGQPYSSRTMLADLLHNPRAEAMLRRDAPPVLAPIDGTAGFKLPPSFARIVTPQTLTRSVPDQAAMMARLDRDLGAIPSDPQVEAGRCAGYDTKPPRLPATIRRPALLVFDKITGFLDQPSVDAAAHALQGIADRNGWTLVTMDNAAVFNARDLARFDAVVWNNVSGDALTLTQRAQFKRWMERGGGFVGIHGSGGDPVWFWDWYADELIGARFIGHPGSPQFQVARVVVDDPDSWITAGLGKGWTMSEEWYSFGGSPRRSGAHVLATLDEATYAPLDFEGRDIRMGDHPIAWTRCVGDGRSFYSAIGHRPESYSEPHSLALLERGIAWAMGGGGARCRAARETPSVAVSNPDARAGSRGRAPGRDRSNHQ